MHPGSGRHSVAEAGLDYAVDVSVTGIDPPRQARLIVSADPSEIPDHPTLARRIRDALRDCHIALALPDNDPDTASAAQVDERLLDAEPVRLARLLPRS
ncbi:MAG TPA: hypothetical protein VGN37_04455 [Actinocatenispora sp.]